MRKPETKSTKSSILSLGSRTISCVSGTLLQSYCATHILSRYFLDIRHHVWLNVYHATITPQTAIYTIGNPLIAQSILKHDLDAGLHIPPRLLVQEKPEGKGTRVMYQLPSSIMVLPGSENTGLKELAEGLDRKFEALMRKITEAKDGEETMSSPRL